MAVPVLSFLRRLVAPAAMVDHLPAVGPRHRQLLLDTGRVLMMLAAAVILTHQPGASRSSDAELLFLTFVLWLLGTALVTMSLAAGQFPRLAAAGVNVARVLRNYLLGGL
jgi:hypothetical protein